MSFTGRAQISSSVSLSNSYSFAVLRCYGPEGAWARLVWLWKGAKKMERSHPAASAAHGHPSNVFWFKTHRSSCMPEHKSEGMTRLSPKLKFSWQYRTAQRCRGIRSGQFSQRVLELCTAEASSSLSFCIGEEEVTFVKISNTMLLNIPEVFCHFWKVALSTSIMHCEVNFPLLLLNKGEKKQFSTASRASRD